MSDWLKIKKVQVYFTSAVIVKCTRASTRTDVRTDVDGWAGIHPPHNGVLQSVRPCLVSYG